MYMHMACEHQCLFASDRIQISTFSSSKDSPAPSRRTPPASLGVYLPAALAYCLLGMNIQFYPLISVYFASECARLLTAQYTSEPVVPQKTKDWALEKAVLLHFFSSVCFTSGQLV